jgi:hypothetical protein
VGRGEVGACPHRHSSQKRRHGVICASGTQTMRWTEWATPRGTCLPRKRRGLVEGVPWCHRGLSQAKGALLMPNAKPLCHLELQSRAWPPMAARSCPGGMAGSKRAPAAAVFLRADIFSAAAGWGLLGPGGWGERPCPCPPTSSRTCCSECTSHCLWAVGPTLRLAPCSLRRGSAQRIVGAEAGVLVLEAPPRHPCFLGFKSPSRLPLLSFISFGRAFTTGQAAQRSKKNANLRGGGDISSRPSLSCSVSLLFASSAMPLAVTLLAPFSTTLRGHCGGPIAPPPPPPMGMVTAGTGRGEATRCCWCQTLGRSSQ